jgi:hypothetical protein
MHNNVVLLMMQLVTDMLDSRLALVLCRGAPQDL